MPEVSELGPQSRPQVKRCTASFSARLLLVSAALFGAVAMALWRRERVAPLGHRLSALLLLVSFWIDAAGFEVALSGWRVPVVRTEPTRVGI